MGSGRSNDVDGHLRSLRVALVLGQSSSTSRAEARGWARRLKQAEDKEAVMGEQREEREIVDAYMAFPSEGGYDPGRGDHGAPNHVVFLLYREQI